MFSRLRRPIVEAIEGFRFLRETSASAEAMRFVRHQNEDLRALKESNLERISGLLAERDALVGMVSDLERENRLLAKKIDWLTRRRKQAEVACPFPDHDRVVYYPSDRSTLACICYTKLLTSNDIWSPVTLDRFEEFPNV